tara:strand:+ start:12147 stop:13280 length:1134 start_codon:yes stop_codon:yes gene_type:complete
MSKSVLFCHDHMFSFYQGNYYSAGKLDYDKFKFYLNFFDSVVIISRVKNVDSLTSSDLLATGPGVSIYPVDNLSSLKGLLNIRKVEKDLEMRMNKVDSVIVRLPSEIGILAAKVALKLGKPLLGEVVANAKDCLMSQSNLKSKLYANVLDWRVKKIIAKLPNAVYVTKLYLQDSYPNIHNTIAVSDVVIKSINEPKTYTPKGKCVIGLIGNPDVHLKGVDVAIKAINQLGEAGYNVELQVVGGEGKQYIIDNGYLPKNVKFLGAKDSTFIFDWFNSIDLYVQPSLTEGLPRALIEAMSSGTPCLASNVGGIPELLNDEYLFARGDFRSLAKKLSNLISDQKSYATASNNVVNSAKSYTRTKLEPNRSKFYRNFFLNT